MAAKLTCIPHLIELTQLLSLLLLLLELTLIVISLFEFLIISGSSPCLSNSCLIPWRLHAELCLFQLRIGHGLIQKIGVHQCDLELLLGCLHGLVLMIAHSGHILP